MKRIQIVDKLHEIGVDIKDVSLGDFDQIAEFTAKRSRDHGTEFYKKSGMFYRSNYERGILVYYLIKQFNLTSLLEVGFGRGYVSLCAAKAFNDIKVSGRVVTIDPNFNQEFLNAIFNVFPKEWTNTLELVRAKSEDVLEKMREEFDLVYIDGDHSYEATKYDWENTKDKYKKFLLFDDYHLPEVNDPGIQCRQLIDEIDDPTKELIIMDRRIFVDDLKRQDNEIKYGQVLLTKEK